MINYVYHNPGKIIFGKDCEQEIGDIRVPHDCYELSSNYLQDTDVSAQIALIAAMLRKCVPGADTLSSMHGHCN